MKESSWSRISLDRRFLRNMARSPSSIPKGLEKMIIGTVLYIKSLGNFRSSSSKYRERSNSSTASDSKIVRFSQHPVSDSWLTAELFLHVTIRATFAGGFRPTSWFQVAALSTSKIKLKLRNSIEFLIVDYRIYENVMQLPSQVLGNKQSMSSRRIMTRVSVGSNRLSSSMNCCKLPLSYVCRSMLSPNSISRLWQTSATKMQSDASPTQRTRNTVCPSICQFSVH